MGIDFDDAEHHHSDCSVDSGCSDFRSALHRPNGNGQNTELTHFSKFGLSNRQLVYRKPIGNEHGNEFLSRVVELIIDDAKIVGHPQWVQANNSKVIDFKQPAELKDILQLHIGKQPMSRDELLALCEQVIQYSPKTSHPLFCNQLYAGVDEFGLAGAWLTDALNTSQATYEISPVFTLMEREIIKYLGSKVGWPRDSIDGIFSPGGSLANMYGMICARQWKFPEIKQRGHRHLGQLVIFASDGSHYSYVKGAIWMGLGAEAVIKVTTDAQGRMRPDVLEQLIQKSLDEGRIPFFCGCTSGTTVLSAFDQLDQIRRVCNNFGLWMHVDSALGGTVLFSPRLRHLMHGVETADSITWNLHKMAGAPMQCSAFLIRHDNLLAQANGLNAEYLFQNDKYYDASYDSGDKAIQCGRKVDSLKLWLHLASKGDQLLQQSVENVFHQVQWFTKQLLDHPRFRLVLPKFEGCTVCFWYVPESIDCIQDQQQKAEQLHKVCPAIKRRLVEEGTVMINYQPLTCKRLPNFFRMVLTCCPEMNEQNLAFIISEIDRVGRFLYPN